MKDEELEFSCVVNQKEERFKFDKENDKEIKMNLIMFKLL
jgi:hypothetical protein